MNVNELLTLVREYVDEEAADASDYSDAGLLSFMNAEHRHLASAIRRLREDWFGKKAIFLLSGNQSSYPLPLDCVHPRWVELIRNDGSVSGTAPFYTVNEVAAVITTLDPVEIDDRDVYHYLNSNGRFRSVEGYFLFDDEIYFTPGTSIDGKYCRLWYHHTMPDLHRAQATAGAANTITLGVAGGSQTLGSIRTIDNYYQRMGIEIVNGTGVGQRNRIATYVGATRVATVETPWATAPDASSVYSITSPIKEDWQELIALGGAMRAKGIKTEDDTTELGQVYSVLMKDMIGTLDQRNQQRTRRVRTTVGREAWF